MNESTELPLGFYPQPESWRWIEGCVGTHKVSNHGRIASFYSGAEVRLLSIRVDAYGYLVAKVRGRNLKVHKAVLDAFCPSDRSGPLCLHNNDDKLDPRLWNLRHGSHADNALDSVRNRTNYGVRKTACPFGHRLSAPNLRSAKKRGCLSCNRARSLCRKRGEVFREEVAHEYYRNLLASC